MDWMAVVLLVNAGLILTGAHWLLFGLEPLVARGTSYKACQGRAGAGSA